ncbi:unnamed protein product, partial [Didymodactylos carnosus]
RFLDDERFSAGRTSVVDPALLSGDTARFREEVGGDDCSLLTPIEYLKLFRCSSLLNQLQTYLLDNDRFNISVVALDPSLPTNYTPATTTGDILKMLMVED